MRSRTVATLFSLFLLAGCAPEERAPPSGTGDPTLPSGAADGQGFVPVADVQQLMLSILEPAAEVYWESVGWVIDAEGTREIVPDSEEEWEAVRDAAYVVAESGNLLMMEGRRRDGPWNAYSQAMIEVAQRAIHAAESQDRDAVFELGGEVYLTCTACHSIYAVETLRPSAVNE